MQYFYMQSFTIDVNDVSTHSHAVWSVFIHFTFLYLYSICLCSGDGRLVAIDLRKKGLEEKSDQMESELLCVEVIKVYD